MKLDRRRNDPFDRWLYRGLWIAGAAWAAGTVAQVILKHLS